MKAAICERPAAISPNTEKIAHTIKTAATRTLRRSNGRKLAASTVAPTTVVSGADPFGIFFGVESEVEVQTICPYA